MFINLVNFYSCVIFFILIFYVQKEIKRLSQGLFVFFYYIIKYYFCRVFEEENDVIERDLNKEENFKFVVFVVVFLENLGKILKLLKFQNGMLI